MRNVLDSPFSTSDVARALGVDVRKTTAAMKHFRRQLRGAVLVFASDGRIHNARKAYRAFRRRLKKLRRLDPEGFDTWTAGLARDK